MKCDVGAASKQWFDANNGISLGQVVVGFGDAPKQFQLPGFR